MAQYPPKNVEKAAAGARIAHVEPGSPADDVGFEPGCIITTVDGHPLRDVIDWRWHADSDEVRLGYIDLDGDEGEVELWREPGEEWGIEFADLVFDGVRQCRNACTFCFMHQLPRGMRPSLYLRDDDYRLSFLIGTFVTLTNMTPEDEARVVEQRISPLRMSLQATDPEVRRRLIGKHAQQGIDSLERLLAAGIEFHAQIVLVPGQNDGDVLRDTLAWAYARPGILEVGIVPLGYTRHQARFDHSFNDAESSRALLDAIAPFQHRAQRERGCAWVYAADEFYRNAWRDDLLAQVPDTAFYGDFSMFEDGVGIIRSTLDDWEAARSTGSIARAAAALREAGIVAYMVVGCAQREFLDALVDADQIADVFHPLYVANDYFGGNVDVTGLLVGADIVRAVKSLHAAGVPGASPADGMPDASPQGRAIASVNREAHVPGKLVLVPRVVFNDDGLTLDDMDLPRMQQAAGCCLHVVSCTPLEYFDEIAALAETAHAGDANDSAAPAAAE